MKKTFINIRRVGLRALVGSFALLALLSFVLPQAVQASTASNTVIRNTATVNYKDTANNSMPSVSSTVDITVAFVCATPLLSAPGDGTTDPATNEIYTYTLTSQSNGPDTYAISAAVTAQSAGISGSTATPSTASIILGATTAAAAAASGTAVITVPNDNSNDSSVNGIVATDIVVIGGNPYTVSAISDGGTTIPGTSTITLTTNLSTNVAAGDPIYERQTFTVTVDPGPVTLASNQTITVLTTADGACVAATDETITTVTPAVLGIVKEVSPNGTNWYLTAGAPQFAPGATVYYRITVTNSGSSNANAATVTDPLPAYTTYVANSTLLNNITVINDGATSPLIAGVVVDDNLGRAPAALASGVLLPAGVATIIYRVTIN
jgi:uncharacterized repeat protein (TIGR01451 family)